MAKSELLACFVKERASKGPQSVSTAQSDY